MGLLSPEIWGVGESFHCFGSSGESLILGISVHALVAGVSGVKALKAVSSLSRVCLKVGKGSSYKFFCPPLPSSCSSQRVQRVGDRKILGKAKEGMEN